MENLWLARAKKLHAIAQTGLAFAKDEYDIERYEEVAEIARDMISELSSIPMEQLHQILATDLKQYITPQIDVRAAIFNQDKVLLVKEKSDGRWTLPGGYADVGLSAAENVEKEVLEEAGIHVQTKALYSVRHKAKGEYDLDVRDFYKLFFVCEATNGMAIKTGPETSDVGFFEIECIPQLSTGRVILRDIEEAFTASKHPGYLTIFD